MLEVFVAADMKSAPARIWDPVVLFSKALGQVCVPNRPGERKVNHPASVHVSDFRASQAELPASEAMGVNRTPPSHLEKAPW
jgi:hypothetical protein